MAKTTKKDNENRFGNSPVCKRLAEFVTKHNIGDLSKELGVSEQAIRHWTQGVSRPDIDKLVDIATFWGITVDKLLSPINDEQTLSTPKNSELMYSKEEAEAYDLNALENSLFNKLVKPIQLIVRSFMTTVDFSLTGNYHRAPTETQRIISTILEPYSSQNVDVLFHQGNERQKTFVEMGKLSQWDYYLWFVQAVKKRDDVFSAKIKFENFRQWIDKTTMGGV
jgi:transcriptional regulator with XRE-family HTH domain